MAAFLELDIINVTTLCSVCYLSLVTRTHKRRVVLLSSSSIVLSPFFMFSPFETEREEKGRKKTERRSKKQQRKQRGQKNIEKRQEKN